MEPKKSTAGARIFVLPPQVTGNIEINRLLRELEILEEAFISLSGRQDKKSLPPKVTTLLDQTALQNGYNLLEKKHRQHLTAALTQIRTYAPALHISFAAEPSPKVVEAILGWLRSNIHSYALLQIGLQPTIAAGCVLRTPNKVFDLSLRASFEKQKPYLVELIKGAVAAGER